MRWLTEIKIGAGVAMLALSLTIPSLAKAETDEVWNVLQGFQPVNDSVLQVSEHYVLALFHNAETEVFALVLFNVDCEGNACWVNRAAAYSLYGEGVNFFTHVDPRDQELAFGGGRPAGRVTEPFRADGAQI